MYLLIVLFYVFVNCVVIYILCFSIYLLIVLFYEFVNCVVLSIC